MMVPIRSSKLGTHQTGALYFFASHLMSKNRSSNLSKLRYPYAASIMAWTTSFPACIFALLSTTPNSFFTSPLAIP